MQTFARAADAASIAAPATAATGMWPSPACAPLARAASCAAEVRMRRFALLALACFGCAETPDESPRGLADAGACSEGASSCRGAVHVVCRGGAFVDLETCDGACVPGGGCAQCAPDAPTFCDGADVVACRADGTRGEVVETCAAGCAGGRCADDCAPGSELIYAVDVEQDLLAFDPRTEALRPVGRIDCPAGRELGGRRTATPFSMAVDRGGRAWVLYSSGEIFHVDTATAECAATGFRAGQGGFELFGMAFVADAPGRPEETLYIAGGAADDLGAGRLGRVDTTSLRVTAIGTMRREAYGAELTGNGNGELFAYVPGRESSVVRLDKTSAAEARRWSLPPLSAQPAGWAFAHWGGRYFVFISTQNARGLASSRVLRFDPESGETVVAIEDVGRRIVGAGVSTCAPVVSNF
jgi:hypothetical protein